MPSGGVLCCAGKLDGTPCPHAAPLRLTNLAEATHRLENFHMDHTHDAAHICQVWSDALPLEPTSWDEGICGGLLAQLLFGVDDHPMADVDARWKRQIVIRCGNRKGVRGQRASDFCHDLARAHYTHTLRVEDLRVEEAGPSEATTLHVDDPRINESESNDTIEEVDLTLEDGANEDNAIDLAE